LKLHPIARSSADSRALAANRKAQQRKGTDTGKRMRHHYALSCIALLVLLGFKASLVIAQTSTPPPSAPMPPSPSAAPVSSSSDPTPYVDRLLENSKSNKIAADDDEQDTPNADGLPRSIRIELQRSHTLSSGNITSSGNGLAIRTALDTPNFGSLTLDTQLGANQIVSTSSPGAVRSATLTLQQIGLPLGAGWFANNILGILGPTQVGLARQQLRFSIPSRTIEGVATELLSPDGAALTATLGELGQLEGFPISGFRRTGGQFAQAGGQWRASLAGNVGILTSAVTTAIARNAPNDLGIGLRVDNNLNVGNQLASKANFDSVLIAQRYERDGLAVQANVIRSSSTANSMTQTGNGWWIDATQEVGRTRHSLGIFSLGTGLNWGGLAVNSDVEGGYYRFSYQSLRWSADAAVETLRSVSGTTSPGQFINSNLRYQWSRDLSFGGGAAVRSYNGTGSQVFGYVQSQNRFGTGRAQIDLSDATTGERNQAITLDQSWNEITPLTLSTSLSYAHQQGIPLKRESVSLSLNAGGELFSNLSLNANIQSRYTTSGPVDNALYATVGLMWRLNRHWSFSGNATVGSGRYDSGVVSLDPLAAPLSTISHPSQRTYLLILRYEDRAGTVIAPIGGRAGGGGGAVTGYVYFDANANSLRDANETGVPSVAVILDGRFSTRTDAQGRFEFPFVGSGEHVISVASDNLPLPWGLINEGTTRITVSPRASLQINIPAVRAP